MPVDTHIGVAVPKAPGDPEPGARLRGRLQTLEAAGVDSLWVTDSGLGYVGSLAPTPLLAFVAGVTSRVALGAAVYVLPVHQPVRLAQDLATVDQLCGGRLIVGFGIGGKDGDYGPYGVERAGRVERYESAIHTVRAVWQDGPTTVAGPDWELDSVQVEPKPARRPGPPIWFGGRSDAALRRAAELGDGFIGAGSMSTADFLGLLVDLRSHLDVAERGEGFRVGKRVYLAVDDDGRAREQMRSAMGTIYRRPELADDVALIGSYDHCLEELRSLQEAGTDTLVLHPLFDLDRQLAHVTSLMHDLRRG